MQMPRSPPRQPCRIELSVTFQGMVVFVFFHDCLHTKFRPSLILSEGGHMEMQMGVPSALALRVSVERGTPQESEKCVLPEPPAPLGGEWASLGTGPGVGCHSPFWSRTLALVMDSRA